MKTIVFFLLLCSVDDALSAQVTTSARAGASFSSVYFKGDNSNQGRIAGYGGIAVKVDLQNQLYFQPELLYSIRGYKFPPSNFNTGGRVSFGYITVPLLAGYKGGFAIAPYQKKENNIGRRPAGGM